MEDPNQSKRRRGPGVVTANACTECRNKRAKCDGANPCARCKSQGTVPCVYETPIRQSKEKMRAEIDRLRMQLQQSDRVLTALVSSDGSDSILEQLRIGRSVGNISDSLDVGEGTSLMRDEVGDSEGTSNVTIYKQATDQQGIQNVIAQAQSKSVSSSSPFSSVGFGDTFAEPTRGQNMPEGLISLPTWPTGPGPSRYPSDAGPPDDIMRWSPDIHSLPQPGSEYPLIGALHETTTGSEDPSSTVQWARKQGKRSVLGPEFSTEEDVNQGPNPNQQWTQVTSHVELIEHLMALYFCWEYPTFASLSKEHFLDDFRSGRWRHCSSLLVNAILAVGCRFSTYADARVDPNDSDTAGDHFFAEALRLLGLEKNRHMLTVIQALGLMSIREASCGRTTESMYYASQSVMIAIEMGLHLESVSGGGDDASLDHAVKSATFWGAYSLDQAWSVCVGRLPHFSKETKVMAKPAIVEHVERSSWIPYTDDGAPLERSFTQPSNVRSVYRTFCELSEIAHKALYVLYAPETKLTSKGLLDIYTQYLNWYDGIPEALRLGQNFTPAVLFAHMYYHLSILLLFRPFIKLNIIASAVSPRDVCNQAADAISALVKSYSQLYTLRRTPSFIPYFVLTSSITHLVSLGISDGVPEPLHQGISDLKAMTQSHAFARRARNILDFLARHWKVDVVIMDNEDEEGEGVKPESVITRIPKTIGMMRGVNLFAPNVVVEDMMNGIKPPAAQQSPLFWPFPFQDRPLLGDALEEVGFRVLDQGWEGE